MKITVNEAKAGAKTVVGDVSAPVYLYLGESGGGSDRRIKLEGATPFDKLLDLRKAHTYVSIGPADGSREWARLDGEDQKYYKDLQAKAKKLKTYKAMGDFLNQLCSNNECMLFAIRQGDDAVWVHPHILKELLDAPWRGVDSAWLDQAADVKGYWDRVVAARDAGKDYSKIKPENRLARKGMGRGKGTDESMEGWDGWEEVEGLEDALYGIEDLAYELRSCVRGAKTGCKDWKALALYIKGLAANLDDAAEEMAWRRDESKKKNLGKDFSSTVEEDEDGKKKSH